jgi:hypothetical protein
MHYVHLSWMQWLALLSLYVSPAAGLVAVAAVSAPRVRLVDLTTWLSRGGPRPAFFDFLRLRVVIFPGCMSPKAIQKSGLTRIAFVCV